VEGAGVGSSGSISSFVSTLGTAGCVSIELAGTVCPLRFEDEGVLLSIVSVGVSVENSSEVCERVAQPLTITTSCYFFLEMVEAKGRGPVGGRRHSPLQDWNPWGILSERQLEGLRGDIRDIDVDFGGHVVSFDVNCGVFLLSSVLCPSRTRLTR